jgi:hypothetical protein
MEGRECTKCGVWKPREGFHAHKQCKGGINTVCKACRKPLSSKNYKAERQEYRLWYRAKRRSKVDNLPFDIEIEDILIPEKCPVLDIELKVNDLDAAPSLDKIYPEKGYVKGNIVVISNKANRIKSNANPKEILAVAHYFGKLMGS